MFVRTPTRKYKFILSIWVNDVYTKLLLLTKHNLLMILRATNLTFAEARATAVSAKISTTAEPILSSALLRKKHSSTVSIKSDTYKIPNIVAEEDRKARSRNKYNTLPI